MSAATSPTRRPALRGHENTLDQAPRLSGSLNRSDFAQFQVEVHNSSTNGQSTQPTQAGGSRDEAILSDSDSIENYDTQKLDPQVLAAHAQLNLPKHGPESVDAQNGDIAVTLEKTDKRGQYLLHADDPEIRDILKEGMERMKDDDSSSKSRKQRGFKDLVFTRQFTTFDRQSKTASESPFFGFFVLFWIMMACMILRVAAQNWRRYGSILGSNELGEMMFSRDVVVLGLSDGVCYLLTGVPMLLQWAILRGWLKWNGAGMIIQNVWQTAYVLGIIGWTFYREWPWTHTIFLVLHMFVYLMKQHSYAFYNGYLSQCFWRRKMLERKIKQLSTISPVSSPVRSHQRSSSTETVVQTHSNPEAFLRHRRESSRKLHGNLAKEPPEISEVARAIQEGKSLGGDELEFFEKIIKSEIEALEAELRGKASVAKHHYPHNLTVSNWAEYVCLPTLVYELEYPRQETRNWYYIAEKSAATFGCIFLMMVVSQAYIYPTVADAVAMKSSGMTMLQRWQEFPWVISDLLFPLLLEQLLTWYVIWECILNVLAELTKFADRGFYGPWWNSVSWDQYARDWNRPVHNFLLRHVYYSSISALHLNKGAATFVTFFLSALIHECVMFCLFKKVRGYLFMMQLTQIPFAMLARTKLLKGRSLLGNALFWFGLFVGPSVLTALYLIG